MPNHKFETRRESKARDAANEYAPAPVSTSLMYGVVTAITGGLLLVLIGQFYEINIIQYPVWVGIGLVVVFFAGIVLRKSRKRTHNLAFDEEYARGTDKAGLK